MNETLNTLYYIHMLGIIVGLLWVSMGVYFQMIYKEPVRPVVIVSCVTVGSVLVLLSNAVFVTVRSTELFLRIIGYMFMSMLASSIFTYLLMRNEMEKQGD